MKITKEHLVAWQCSNTHLDWFVENFGNRQIEYQPLLNRFAKDDIPDFARWLFATIGATTYPHRTCSAILGKHMYVASGLTVTGSVDLDGDLIVDGPLTIHGKVSVKGIMSCNGPLTVCDDVTVGENVLKVCGDAKIKGRLLTHGTVNVFESLCAEDIKCGSFITANSIHTKGNICANTFIHVNGSICAEGVITAPHGIYAGVGKDPQYWKHEGSIHAKEKPDLIFSGEYCGRLP